MNLNESERNETMNLYRGHPKPARIDQMNQPSSIVLLSSTVIDQRVAHTTEIDHVIDVVPLRLFSQHSLS